MIFPPTPQQVEKSTDEKMACNTKVLQYFNKNKHSQNYNFEDQNNQICVFLVGLIIFLCFVVNKKMMPVVDIAGKLGLKQEDIENYGHYKVQHTCNFKFIKEIIVQLSEISKLQSLSFMLL